MVQFGQLYGMSEVEGVIVRNSQLLIGRRSGMTTQSAVKVLYMVLKSLEPEVERVVFWKRVLDPLV